VLTSRIKDGFLDPGPIHGDIRTFEPDGEALAAEAVIGGWPCQANAKLFIVNFGVKESQQFETIFL